MSLNYPFPVIEHISDVLPHIDDKHFRVAEKECGNTYINYLMMGNNTFPPMDGTEEEKLRSAIRRECRGITFDTRSGKIVSRPFHKFFNAGEREEVTVDADMFAQQHVVWDKLDGSMLRPVPSKTGIRWATKMGVTDTAMEAELWLEKFDKYRDFADLLFSFGHTPIFEYVSPRNRIVVNYPETCVYLLAIRDNFYGTYREKVSVIDIAGNYDIPVVDNYDSVRETAVDFVQSVQDSEQYDEGVVVEFYNGHRVKIKTDTYTTLHRVKDASRTERTLILAILDGKVDDLLPLLSKHTQDMVTRYVQNFWRCRENLSEDLNFLYADMRERYDTKKDFALGYAKELTSIEKSSVFTLWDGKVPDEENLADRLIVNALTSETKWAEFKRILAEGQHTCNFDAGWQEDHEYV